MALRTTEAAVKGLLDRNYNNRTRLTPFLRNASLVMDDVVALATENGDVYPDQKLIAMEEALAAHYYQKTVDPGYSSRSTDKASGSFQGQTGMYLEATFYGQMAAELDNLGYLKIIAAGTVAPSAGAFWLGKTRSESLDFEDRQ